MNQYTYKDLVIEVLDEPSYQYGVENNAFDYSKHYFAAMAYDFPTSMHGVKISKEGQIIHECILIGYGGKTWITENSSLIDGDKLLVCCCNSVFCLSLPDLELLWKTEADPSTCLQIFKYQDHYLVHGVLQVSRLEEEGFAIWEFKDVGILMSINSTNGKEPFKIEKDGIDLINTDEVEYKIDFDGKLRQ